MTHIYVQKTGQWIHHGKVIATGYSGLGADKNDPAAEGLPGQGPIPTGLWDIGTARSDAHLGPCVMPLTPCQGTETEGRSGFFIHGDSAAHPGQASHGCIILDHDTRALIANDPDRLLSVVAEPPA